MTTILGPDLSSYQHGLDLARLADASFVIAKVSEGTYYTDADYDGWRRQAASLGRLFCWYHFLSGEDVHTQVAHCLAKVGDKTLPGMLDVEPTSTYTPTLQHALDWIDAAHAVGLNLRLIYLPRWFWEQIGSPDLTGLRDRGVSLVSSAYPGGDGSPTALYPGDGAAGWQAYGGMTPLLYQFTNQAADGGQFLDYNACRGSVAQLSAYLHSPVPSPTPTGGTDMTYTVEAGWQHDYPDVAAALQQHIPVGTVLDVDHASAYAAMRAFVTAERAGVIEQKLDQVLSHLAAPPAIDINALAAALTPHLAAGATADQVAQAVVTHLATTLAKG